MISRSRLIYALLVALTIIIGLASRRFSFLLPPWLAKNAGDVLYAVMVYWLVGLCFPRLPPVRTALAAGGFCFAIEFLKFVQVPWLAAARHNHYGALVFGSGFHWSNLACYVLGVLAAWLIERTLPAQTSTPSRLRH
jgi:hypothetical protein